MFAQPLNFYQAFTPVCVQQPPVPVMVPKPIGLMKQQKTCHISVKGVWTREEDDKLRAAVMASKPVMWEVVARSVEGRSPKQCRERWMYRLHPDLKKTPFEHWEDQVIYEQKKKIGNRWTQIAAQLPGRTSCSVKNRWYTVLRNRYHDLSETPSENEHKKTNDYSIESLLNH